MKIKNLAYATFVAAAAVAIVIGSAVPSEAAKKKKGRCHGADFVGHGRRILPKTLFTCRAQKPQAFAYLSRSPLLLLQRGAAIGHVTGAPLGSVPRKEGWVSQQRRCSKSVESARAGLMTHPRDCAGRLAGDGNETPFQPEQGQPATL